MAHGGCGEGVNTPGCEPGMRQFNSGQPPHSSSVSLLAKIAIKKCPKLGYFLLFSF